MRPLRIALAILSVLLVPSTAWAHAAYKDSDPQDEATVASPPSSVWAEYTEPLQEHSNLEVYDPCGTRVDDGDTSVTAYRMQVSMSGVKAGTYTVRWVAASAVDPHVTRGAFTFSVTEGDTCPVAAPANDDDRDGDGAATRTDRRDTSSAAGDDATTAEETERTRAGGDRRDARNESAAGRQARDDAAAAGDDDGFVSAQTDDEQESRGIWDGIPLDGFALALAVAAAIGAAGGRIYANIMGPRS